MNRQVANASSGTDVVLVGTAAGPDYTPGRAGICSAVVVGDRHYVVDAGLGAARNLGQAGLEASGLAGMFITHLHSDHLFDLFNLLWMSPGDLPGPVPIIGPGAAGGLPRDVTPLAAPDHPTPGTLDMITGLIGAYAYDINIRHSEVGYATSPSHLFDARDVVLPSHVEAGPENTAPDMEPFVVHEDDRVRVSAVLVPHGPVFPCFAFRFDTDDGSVTLSGDTARSDNVSRLAADASLLVHEAVELDWFVTSGIADRFGKGFLEHMEGAHTSPADVGRIATAAGVPQVALSHVGPGNPDLVPDEQWRKGVAATFEGDVHVGRDLMRLQLRRNGS